MDLKIVEIDGTIEERKIKAVSAFAPAIEKNGEGNIRKIF